MLTGNSIADPCAGLAGCFALLAALHDPDAGRGAHIDLSAARGVHRPARPRARRAAADRAPRSAAATRGGARAPGLLPGPRPGTWIVLAVTDDAAWSALADVAATVLGRRPPVRRCEVRRATSTPTSWTTSSADWTRSATTTSSSPPRCRPPASPPRPCSGPPSSSPTTTSQPGLVPGARPRPRRSAPLPRAAVQVLGHPGPLERAAPTLGQDNDAVLGGRLGLSAERLAELRAARGSSARTSTSRNTAGPPVPANSCTRTTQFVVLVQELAKSDSAVR